MGLLVLVSVCVVLLMLGQRLVWATSGVVLVVLIAVYPSCDKPHIPPPA